MELEELQKIWNEQKGETMYAIDEKTLHNNISKKKNAASRRINKVELALMAINSITGVVLLIDAITDKEGLWDYVFSAVMFLTVLFLAFFRQKRLKQEKTFSRSMLGELDHAIANAHSMVRIATIMIYYYFLPVCVYTSIKMMVFAAPIERWLLIIGAFVLSFFLVYYERKKFHIPRKQRLIKLREKLSASM